MKERPILFSGPMVNAILEGRKTQTRRIVKYPKWASVGEGIEIENGLPEAYSQSEGVFAEINCPYGQIGDILWVRETWCLADYDMGHRPNEYLYAADFNQPVEWNWKPSLFMPRAACRIRLKITNTRVERLQDISESDAKNEGVSNAESFIGIGADDSKANRYAFRELWQKINGTESWDSNPWVWVIQFERS